MEAGPDASFIEPFIPCLMWLKIRRGTATTSPLFPNTAAVKASWETGGEAEDVDLGSLNQWSWRRQKTTKVGKERETYIVQRRGRELYYVQSVYCCVGRKAEDDE